MYDILIIGAGISGATIARELSKYDLKIALLDKENDVSNGSTKANSAIVHAGYDVKPETLMGKYNAKGNAMYEDLCKELHVPFKRCGSLVIAFNEEDMEHIRELYERGQKNGVPKLHIIDRVKTKELEPHIQDGVIGALYSETAGIVGPWELTIALVENAVQNGVDLFLENKVKKIEKISDGFKVTTDKGAYETKKIVNCGGIYADEIHNLIAKPTFKITPRKGEYFVLDKTQGGKIHRTIFQCPTKLGKGVLLTPTVHGNLLVGPDSQEIKDKEDISTSQERLDYVKETSIKSAKNIEFRDIIRTFAGLRAESDRGDFIIGETEDCKGFYDVAGIKSPGLTAAPAVALSIVEMLKKSELNFEKKSELALIKLEKPVNFMELSSEEKEIKIKENPAYGRVICRCEMITEGEIIDTLKRPFIGKSVDAIKKRCRPGMGRCQGGFCGPRVQEIIARELDIELEKIVLDKEESYILTNETKR